MRRYGIKIKSTGFGFFPFFFPIFLAAFVEQDEKSMENKGNFEQMSVLSAGTFANILTTIVGFVLMAGFFVLAFSPSGVGFDDYAYTMTGISSIDALNNNSFDNKSYESLHKSLGEGINSVSVNGTEYFITKDFLQKQKNPGDYVFVYMDSPALKANLSGSITKIGNKEIQSLDSFEEAISSYNPGEEAKITLVREENGTRKEENETIVFGTHPENDSKPWLGVVFYDQQSNLIEASLVGLNLKYPYVDYQPDFSAGVYVYNMLWWLVLISFSVALVNMLPVGIFDGGRFFYLTILGMTKSKKKAERWFVISTKLFIFILVALMIFWAIGIL